MKNSIESVVSEVLIEKQTNIAIILSREKGVAVIEFKNSRYSYLYSIERDGL